MRREGSSESGDAERKQERPREPAGPHSEARLLGTLRAARVGAAGVTHRAGDAASQRCLRPPDPDPDPDPASLGAVTLYVQMARATRGLSRDLYQLILCGNIHRWGVIFSYTTIQWALCLLVLVSPSFADSGRGWRSGSGIQGADDTSPHGVFSDRRSLRCVCRWQHLAKMTEHWAGVATTTLYPGLRPCEAKAGHILQPQAMARGRR